MTQFILVYKFSKTKIRHSSKSEQTDWDIFLMLHGLGIVLKSLTPRYFDPKIFWSQHVLIPRYFDPKIFWTQEILILAQGLFLGVVWNFQALCVQGIFLSELFILWEISNSLYGIFRFKYNLLQIEIPCVNPRFSSFKPCKMQPNTRNVPNQVTHMAWWFHFLIVNSDVHLEKIVTWKFFHSN